MARAHAEVLGSRPLPPPLRVPLSQLHEGEFAARWVEVSGIIRDVILEGDFYLLILRSRGVRMPITVMGVSSKQVPAHWIDAPVTLQGISWPEVDREGKHIGTWINVPNPSFLAVETTAVPKPFDQPVHPIASAPELRTLSDQRLKVSGTVLYQSPSGRIHLRDDTGAAEALPLNPIRRPSAWARIIPRTLSPPLVPGDLIELVGAPTDTLRIPVLLDAEFRIRGRAPLPQPIPIDVESAWNGS